MPIPIASALKGSVREMLDGIQTCIADEEVDYDFINPSEGNNSVTEGCTLPVADG